MDLTGAELFSGLSRYQSHSRAPQQLAPGNVLKDGHERIANSAHDALSLRSAVHAELPMHAGDDEIEAAQNLIGVIQ
jgi:hypothetical protein